MSNPQPTAAPAPWRPMAEAPKDGTPIVIRFDDLTMVVAHFMEGGHCIEDHPAIERGWYFYNGHMMDLIPSKPKLISWAVIPPTFNLPSLDKATGEAVWRICEPNRPMPQAQPTAAPVAPITPEEIAALRDALAKATPGEWRSMRQGNQYIGTGPTEQTRCVAASIVEPLVRPWNPHWIGSQVEAATEARFLDADADFIALAHNLAPKLLAALDAAEAQAVEFAWDTLAFASVDPAAISTNTDYSVYQCLTTASVKAAEYLAARGLLRKTGERMWQRVEGGK